jgi:serine/threonine protein kinase
LAVDQDNEGRWFLAMEWIDRNLEAFILEHEPMSWNRFFNDVGRPLLGAIEHAQRTRNLVHRDLNPRNILVTDKCVPKITDYGISKVLDDRDAWMPAAGCRENLYRCPHSGIFPQRSRRPRALPESRLFLSGCSGSLLPGRPQV